VTSLRCVYPLMSSLMAPCWAPPATQSLRVLYLDDSSTHLLQVRDALTAAGHHIAIATPIVRDAMKRDRGQPANGPFGGWASAAMDCYLGTEEHRPGTMYIVLASSAYARPDG
jgi:hypothetical protein